MMNEESTARLGESPSAPWPPASSEGVLRPADVGRQAFDLVELENRPARLAPLGIAIAAVAVAAIVSLLSLVG